MSDNMQMYAFRPVDKFITDTSTDNFDLRTEL